MTYPGCVGLPHVPLLFFRLVIFLFYRRFFLNICVLLNKATNIIWNYGDKIKNEHILGMRGCYQVNVSHTWRDTVRIYKNRIINQRQSSQFSLRSLKWGNNSYDTSSKSHRIKLFATKFLVYDYLYFLYSEIFLRVP